ncbi:MAG: sigma-70 family RNA polymerase sigma factor [Phycisphaerae bacterium]|nr:sigma-70 family RNA polymerase sigma factor [Phycisphaerae bacterium]
MLEQLTRILNSVAAGDARASEELLPLVYSELRKLAEARMDKTPPGNTLQPTALVHEAYLRLVGADDPGWDGRHHFFGAAAQAMRDILVEQARRKSRLKHGGDKQRADIDLASLAAEPDTEEILAIDGALKELEGVDARSAQVVVLRYFGGLTEVETAAILGVSESTVVRDWRYARAWLSRMLRSTDEDPGEGI